MRRLIEDALDLCRLRTHPLSRYVYPAWEPILWVALCSGVNVIGDTELQTGITQKIVFSVLFGLGETLLMSFWLLGWFRWILKRPISGSIFPLLAVAGSVNLFMPLVDIAPLAYQMLVMVLIAFYGVYVMVLGIGDGLQEKRSTILLALLAYLPAAFLLAIMASSLAYSLGWVIPPSP